MFKILIGNI